LIGVVVFVGVRVGDVNIGLLGLGLTLVLSHLLGLGLRLVLLILLGLSLALVLLGVSLFAGNQCEGGSSQSSVILHLDTGHFTLLKSSLSVSRAG